MQPDQLGAIEPVAKEAWSVGEHFPAVSKPNCECSRPLQATVHVRNNRTLVKPDCGCLGAYVSFLIWATRNSGA